jgi:hypothetical protein
MIKNNSKNILIIAGLLLAGQRAYSQHFNYYKNFDYYTMSGKDSIKDIYNLPNFYVKCSYDDANHLREIAISDKRDWEPYPTIRYVAIIEKKGKNFMFLGSGKERQGYTRALFPKKEFTTDSAYASGDTLLFKKTRKDHITIQLFTNINGDSIYFKEMNFSFDKNNMINGSALSAFELYKEWFSLEKKAYRIVGGVIMLKQDPIMIWQNIKPNSYSGLRNIIKDDFKDMSAMPITLFWLKHSGHLY